MRGTTTLIIHSLDPESLDRVEDFDSINTESDYDPYKDMESLSQNSLPSTNSLFLSSEGYQYGQSGSPSSSPSQSRVEIVPSLTNGRSSNVLSQTKTVDMNTIPKVGQSSVTKSISEKSGPSKQLPILNLIHSNGSSVISSSPPLINSLYHDDKNAKSSTKGLQNGVFHHNIPQSHKNNGQPQRSHNGHKRSSKNSENNMMFHQNHYHHFLMNGHMNEKTFTFQQVGSGMPLSRSNCSNITAQSSSSSSNKPYLFHDNHLSVGNRNHREIQNEEQESSSNNKGLTGFFSRFDKTRQSNERNKFDVNKLSPQLRAELKRIYVY